MQVKRITWVPPVGESFIVSPSREQLAEAVLRAGPEFRDHLSGCYDGGLFYDVDSVAISELKLMYAAPDRFCVIWTECGTVPDSVLASNPSAGGMVTVRPGGNEWLLPQQYFVERALAWRAVDCFLMDGSRCAGLPWMDMTC